MIFIITINIKNKHKYRILRLDAIAIIIHDKLRSKQDLAILFLNLLNSLSESLLKFLFQNEVYLKLHFL